MRKCFAAYKSVFYELLSFFTWLCLECFGTVTHSQWNTADLFPFPSFPLPLTPPPFRLFSLCYSFLFLFFSSVFLFRFLSSVFCSFPLFLFLSSFIHLSRCPSFVLPLLTSVVFSFLNTVRLYCLFFLPSLFLTSSPGLLFPSLLLLYLFCFLKFSILCQNSSSCHLFTFCFFPFISALSPILCLPFSLSSFPLLSSFSPSFSLMLNVLPSENDQLCLFSPLRLCHSSIFLLHSSTPLHLSLSIFPLCLCVETDSGRPAVTRQQATCSLAPSLLLFLSPAPAWG